MSLSRPLPLEAALVAELVTKRYEKRKEASFSLFRRSGRADDANAEELDDDDDEEGLLDTDRPRDDRAFSLRDVSFEVPAGGTLGLIGRGGSGKTTLLKIVARITPPTSGRVITHGRVLPIIDLASGLIQRSLDARGNILLLAQLFGVPRREADRKVAEIITLAELDEHASAHASTYSSSTIRRLAFSTVLGLEPDLLVVDDVLVGDSAFRTRCLSAIAAAASEGTTVLFASHDLHAVRSVCDRALWLEAGEIVELGGVAEVTRAYERFAGDKTPKEAPAAKSAKPRDGASLRSSANEHVSIRAGWVEACGGTEVETLRVGDAGSVRIVLDVAGADVEVRCGLGLVSSSGLRLRVVQAEPVRLSRETSYVAAVALPVELLSAGAYSGRVGAFVEHSGSRTAIAKEDAFTLDVVDLREEAAEGLVEPDDEGPYEITDAEWSFTPSQVETPGLGSEARP